MKKLVCMILALVLGMTAAAQAEQPEAGPDVDNTVLERVAEFFSLWRQEDYDGMLELCSPAWKSGLDNARMELFYALGVKTPLEYEIVNVIGIPEDGFRSVTTDVTMDGHNGREPSRYRLTVSMVREDGQWYVDPDSFRNHEGESAVTAVSDDMEDNEAAVDRAMEFCSFWEQNDYDRMRELCVQDWPDGMSGMGILIDIYMPGTPVSYEFLEIDKTEDKDACSVKMRVTMDMDSGRKPYIFIIPFDMIRKDNEWYIQLTSIKRSEGIPFPETPEAAEEYDDRDAPGQKSSIVMAQRALAFFSAWSRCDYNAMVELCYPAWQKGQKNARLGLLSRLGLVVPTDFSCMSFCEISEINDICDVYLDVMIDPNNGKASELCHCIMTMVMECGQWYVDPDSFRFIETIVTEQVTESSETAKNSAEDCAKAFLDAWKRLDIDTMLELCPSAWKEKQVNPRVSLLMLMGRGTILQYTINEIQGPGGGPQNVAWPMFTVLMDFGSAGGQKELDASVTVNMEADGRWYLDPEALRWQ